MVSVIIILVYATLCSQVPVQLERQITYNEAHIHAAMYAVAQLQLLCTCTCMYSLLT